MLECYLLSQACLTFWLSTCQEMIEFFKDSRFGRMVLENAIHSLWEMVCLALLQSRTSYISTPLNMDPMA